MTRFSPTSINTQSPGAQRTFVMRWCTRPKRFLGIDIDPEREITVSCGSTEAMIDVLLAVINPGDEVIVFEPFYENYGPDAIISGATPRYVQLATAGLVVR